MLVVVPNKHSYEEIAAENDALHRENDALHREVDVLHVEISRLTDLTETQNRKIAELERKIGRNSSNSSLPPSSDRFAPAGVPPVNRTHFYATDRSCHDFSNSSGGI